MKIQIGMKSPDVMYDLIQEASTHEEKEALEKIRDTYFTYGEYLIVEFDTVEETSKALIVG
tara:strand:+ start:8807 stop:8989 length:183 start_codon:yes stop_codon:yes gene_type:complete